jgi:hypothetical protein
MAECKLQIEKFKMKGKGHKFFIFSIPFEAEFCHASENYKFAGAWNQDFTHQVQKNLRKGIFAIVPMGCKLLFSLVAEHHLR